TAQKGKKFAVRLMEKVGTSLWYRGVLDGKTVWIRYSELTNEPAFAESKTSRLGHLKSANVRIYEDYKKQSVYKEGKNYTHAAYYIKLQANYNGTTYYRISKKPSSEVVGWVKASDVTAHEHTAVDKKAKTFY